MTKDEVLKLALEALKTADKNIIAGGISSNARLQMKNATVRAVWPSRKDDDEF